VGDTHTVPGRQQAVALNQAWDIAARFLPAVRRAELRLLPKSHIDAAFVEWRVPGTRFPRAFKAGAYRKAWLETVPMALGGLEATLHDSPVGDHRTGPLVAHRDGVSAVFGAYEPLSVDEYGKPVGGSVVVREPPLTIGVVTGSSPDGIVVTDEGIWHTFLPDRLSLVGFGANLGVYLAHLTSPGSALSSEECREVMSHYWIGVVSVLAGRSAQYCLCGRDIGEHKPPWSRVRAAAAASGRLLPGTWASERARAD
jgi:hypothetical protein